MATTPEAQEAAAKERIINHMNADHSDSIRRYLQAFQHRSFYQVRNARMADITLSDMKLDCGGQRFVVPFDPPMKSLREARERTVQLDKDALRILGHSDISLAHTAYLPPHAYSLLHAYHFTQCLVVMAAFSRAANFTAGSWLHDLVLYRWPSFVAFCLAIQLYLITFLVVVHSLEAAIMGRKLIRHGLTPLDGCWWAWVASCLVEGGLSYSRVDWLVAQRRKEKEARKH